MAGEIQSVTDRLRIFEIRNEPVVLDTDLAKIYGIETGQFNRAIKRNAARFPKDFAFQLTQEEWDALRCQIGTLKPGRSWSAPQVPAAGFHRARRHHGSDGPEFATRSRDEHLRRAGIHKDAEGTAGQ